MLVEILQTVHQRACVQAAAEQGNERVCNFAVNELTVIHSHVGILLFQITGMIRDPHADRFSET